MCLDEGVRHVRTVADCHRSNGFIERGNRTLRNIIEKLTSVEQSRMDKLSIDVVISDAVTVKNSYIRKYKGGEVMSSQRA